MGTQTIEQAVAAAEKFFKDELANKSTVSQLVTTIWSGCIAGDLSHCLIANELFVLTESMGLSSLERMNDLKNRSLAGDAGAFREGLSILTVALSETIREAAFQVN